MSREILKGVNAEARKKIMETLTERLKKAIESNEELRWDSMLTKARGFLNIATNRQYTGLVNNILLYFAAVVHNGDPRFLTFNQLKDLSKGKAYVLKGSALTPIFCPTFKKVEKGEEEAQEKEKAKEDEEKAKQQLVGFHVAYVANVRQTNLIQAGIIHEGWENKNQDAKPIESLETFAALIDFKQTTSYACPHYSPSKDEIGVPPFEHFDNNFAHAESLAHELIHWTGAKHRLNRLAENWQNKEEYSREELVACLGSAFLLCQLGIEINEQHITNATAYLKGWIRHLENNIEELLEAAIEADRAVAYLVKLTEGK